MANTGNLENLDRYEKLVWSRRFDNGRWITTESSYDNGRKSRITHLDEKTQEIIEEHRY